MRPIAIIAAKEMRDGLRNRWVIATTALLAALALTLAFLGAAPTGTVKVGALGVTIVSLSSLSIFLVPLIALLLSYDAIVGEAERGTHGPAARLSGAALAGRRRQVRRPSRHPGAARRSSATASRRSRCNRRRRRSAARSEAFALMVASSAMLGGVFIAIGYFVSALVKDRGAAGGIAIGVWLFFVLLYDMGLLGALVADQGKTITAGAVERCCSCSTPPTSIACST